MAGIRTKPFQVTTVGESVDELRLAAAHQGLAEADFSTVPKSLASYVPLARTWGLRCDALRQYHMSKHSMREIFAVHDIIEKDLPKFERFWKKIERKLGDGELPSDGEDAFWALATVYAEVEAQIIGHGRPKDV